MRRSSLPKTPLRGWMLRRPVARACPSGYAVGYERRPFGPDDGMPFGAADPGGATVSSRGREPPKGGVLTRPEPLRGDRNA